MPMHLRLYLSYLQGFCWQESASVELKHLDVDARCAFALGVVNRMQMGATLLSASDVEAAVRRCLADPTVLTS